MTGLPGENEVIRKPGGRNRRPGKGKCPGRGQERHFLHVALLASLASLHDSRAFVTGKDATKVSL
jgi:hypothetical protein